MKCKYCNAEVAPNARFCTSCGGDLSKFDKCVNCGEFIDKGESTCPHCGTEQPQLVSSEKGGFKKWLVIFGIILILGVLGGAGYYFMGNKGNSSVETDSIAEIGNSIITDVHSAEGIKSRLNEIFTKGLHMSDEAAVNKFFSQEFRQLYSKVDIIDKTIYAGEIGYWNGSIWDGSQDDEPNGYEIVRVSTSSPSEALIDINLLSDYEGRHNEQKVSLFLVFENDNWFIDDILDFQYKERMKEYIDSSKKESPISIKELRSVSLDKTLPQQGFSYTTFSVREGYETDIWYKNCEIDKDRNIHSVKENACVVELFDGMSASLRITVFDKNIFETVKEQVLEYSVKTENGYCFKWNKDEMSHISMGESDYFEGGHFIDISIITIK